MVKLEKIEIKGITNDLEGTNHFTEELGREMDKDVKKKIRTEAI